MEIAVVLGVLFVLTIIIAVSCTLIQNKSQECNTNTLNIERNKLLSKFGENPHVNDWAQQIAFYIYQDVSQNIYQKRTYNIYCYEYKVVVKDIQHGNEAFVFYFAKFDLQHLSQNMPTNGVILDECDILAEALANNICQRFEQYGLQADITFEASEEPTCFSKYDEEDFPSIYTIIYSGKKGKNKW